MLAISNHLQPLQHPVNNRLIIQRRQEYGSTPQGAHKCVLLKFVQCACSKVRMATWVI